MPKISVGMREPLPSSRNVDEDGQKNSLAPARAARPPRAHRPERLFQQREGLGVEGVIHPSALAAVRHQAGVLQGLEVERQAGLAGLQGVGEVADTLLALSELLDHAEPRLVGKGMEPARHTRQVHRRDAPHGSDRIKLA